MTGSQAPAPVAWDPLPGHWGNTEGSCQASGYPEAVVSAMLLVPAKGVEWEVMLGPVGSEHAKHLKLVMQRKVQSPGHPLFCAGSQVCMLICKDSHVFTLLIKLT